MDEETKDPGPDMSYFKRTKGIREFKELSESLKVNELGCVMLRVDPINIWNSDFIRELLDPDDLYVSSNPELFWVDGDVSNEGHLTLLYGLMTPAYEQKDNVDLVLEDWVRPTTVRSESVTAFPSPFDNENYAAIVARVYVSELDDAHARLSYLPHVDVHAKYLPHITLFYVKASVAEYWVNVLNRFPLEFTVSEDWLDYGSKDAKKA